MHRLQRQLQHQWAPWQQQQLQQLLAGECRLGKSSSSSSRLRAGAGLMRHALGTDACQVSNRQFAVL